MKCKCGCEKFFIQKKGSQTGVYCSKCGKWQKWGNKNYIRLIQHKEEEEVNKSETDGDGTVTIPLKRYLELLRIEQGR